MAQTIPPIDSPRYQGRFAVAAPELGMPYLAEAALTMTSPHDRHAHAEIQALWIVEGTMGMEIGREALQVPAGGALILLPGHRHRVVPPGGPSRARIVDLRLVDTSTDPLVGFVRRLPPHCAIPGDPAAVADAARRLGESLQFAGVQRSARMMSAVWDLLAALHPVDTPNAAGVDGTTDAPAADDDPRLTQAEQFIVDHIADRIGVDAIADAVGLSRSQLTRLTVRSRGLGPAEWLRAVRVGRARQLLIGSTLAIKEIARVCGFVSQNHFSRVYFETTGKRPSAERAGIPKNPELRTQN
jgi:AraC-like DNA-binding protein